jgi:hypothetical protein
MQAVHLSSLAYPCDGVELNGVLVLYARALARRHRLTQPVCRFYRADMWRMSLDSCAHVCVQMHVYLFMPSFSTGVAQWAVVDDLHTLRWYNGVIFFGTESEEMVGA